MKYAKIPANISGIYKINFPNGKIYIGRAKNIKTRIWEHYSKKDSTPCQKALWKYYTCYNEIDVDILEQIVDYDLNTICDLERKWIKEFYSNNREIGYNLTLGGDGADCGVNNSASKISQEDLDNIILLLQEKKTNTYIAQIYNLHPDTIGRINQGTHYYNNKLKYPIRPECGIVEYKEKYNSFSNEQLDLALFLLSTTNLTRKEIAEKTQISIYTLSNLNMGKHPYCKEINMVFPIRISKKTNPLSQEEILEIKKSLLNPNLSIQDIANRFNCSRDTIGDINQGKRYRQDGETYPIRTFYPLRGSKKSVSTILGSEE